MNRERIEARMTDREALAAALERVENEVALWGAIDSERDPFMADIKLNATAARERLAQLPEKCGTCINKAVPGFVALGQTCPTCHGSGKVYPAELVERIATVFLATIGYLSERDLAVAVLDALNGETE